MLSHGDHLGDNRLLGPVNAEHFSKLLQVLGSSLSDREDGIAEPAHAKIAQLLVEELDTQLTGKKRNVFNDGKAHTPLLVLGQLDNGREKRLRKKVDANDWKDISRIQAVANKLESHLC
jgi:hypothetical protein